MTDKIMALFAYAVLAAFLVTLVIYVPRWDLGGVIALTLLLAGYDTLQAMRQHEKPPQDPADRGDA